MSDYLEHLSEVQREAARHYEGAAMIIAGAGSGKTRVLTYRIAHMLEQGVRSYNILALTFTNKAAREMKERIENIVSPERARSLWMGTFHSVFARILRSEADKLGYPSSFTIYDTADSKNVVRALVKEMNLSDETYKVGDIYSRISLAKNNLVTAAAYEANTMLVAEDRERRRPQFAELYKRYVQRCKENGAMDFDDLLLNMNILFRDFPDVLRKYQEQFRYIMVDEYQDTNMAQYLIVKRLAERYQNICVVGDDAQSIYSFRGAKIENILRFQKDYPDARLFKLEQNYRSTQTIVNAANSIIDRNKRQIRKKSFSANAVGDKIRVFKSYTDQEEALIVTSDIYSLLREKHVQYSDIAILYRTNAQSRSLEESFRRRNIPYRIYGGQSFYQRKEIKDLLAYIRLVVNHKDDEALRRVINYPARGIGDVTVGRIAEAARQRGISLWEAIATLTPEEMELRGAAVAKIRDFTAMIQELTSAVYRTEAYEMGLRIATRSGIIGSFKMQQTPEAVSVLENIDELLNSIASFAESRREEDPENTAVTLDDWLQNVSLLTDMDNEKEGDRNRVTLMTVHSAKGLEFEYVYIVGLEETLFPSQMCSETLEGLEEERRLFYVALTRAKQGAALTFSETRFRWGSVTASRPSRFLKEIDPQYLDLQYKDELAELQERIDAEGEEPAPARRFRPYGQREGEAERGRTFGRREQGGQSRFAGGRPERPEMPGKPAMRPAAPRPTVTPGMKSIGRRTAAVESAAPAPGPVPVPAGSGTGGLRVGCPVEHAKFGRGKVSALEDTMNGAKATVLFDTEGAKTLLLKYARLKVIG